MKCPHCRYLYGYCKENDYKLVEGEDGPFYSLPVKMEREDHETRVTLYACPKCGKTFIEI